MKICDGQVKYRHIITKPWWQSQYKDHRCHPFGMGISLQNWARNLLVLSWFSCHCKHAMEGFSPKFYWSFSKLGGGGPRTGTYLTDCGNSQVKDKTVSSLTWKSPYPERKSFILKRGPDYQTQNRTTLVDRNVLRTPTNCHKGGVTTGRGRACCFSISRSSLAPL